MPMLSKVCIVSLSSVSAWATTDGLCRAARARMLYFRAVDDPDVTWRYGAALWSVDDCASVHM
jgi:hypothetical protein